MMHSWVVALLLGILSSTHLVNGHGDEPQATFTGDPYSDDGCNENRGCFDCRAADATCTMTVAWLPDLHEGVVTFWMWGRVEANEDAGYLAVGISESVGMFDTDVYACLSDSAGNAMARYWNPSATDRTPVPYTDLIGVSDQTVSKEDGEIRCTFKRNMTLDVTLPVTGAEYFDISSNTTSHYLILALGATSPAGAIGYHFGTKGSSEPVVLAETFSAGAGETMEGLMKAHGIMMIIAWIGLASIGLTMARYFKPMWPDSKLCGVKIWFAIHRACMVTAVLVFTVAFIIIFVHVGGFLPNGELTDTKRRFTHAILGVIVTALGIINPIMAIFRPHPGTENRPIFDWAHWGVGTSALILSYVTVGLALVPIPFGTAGQNMIPNLESYTFWVLVAFCAFMFVMWIIFEVVRCSTDSEGRTNDIPLGDKNEAIQAPDSSQSGTYFLSKDSQARSQTTREDAEILLPHRVLMPDQGSLLKTILLFIFSLGTVFVVAFLLITIAIA